MAKRRNEWGERHCRKCDQWLADFEFHKNSASSDGLAWTCKTCAGKRARIKVNPIRKELLVAQGGKCAICGKDITGAGTVHGGHLDHDHACCDMSGAVSACGKCNRGLLCQGCNFGLGFFDDSPERLSLAIEYLRFWRDTHDQVVA